MKEFKGTNGGWSIQEPYNTFVYGSDGKLICQIKYDPFSEESTANAQLIATAPELLKASIAALRFIQKTGINHDNADIYNSLNSAINKAMGL